MRGFVLLISAVLVLSSCEKEIILDLEVSEPRYVIEGSITDQPGPYTIQITRSVGFYEPNSFPEVTGAMVRMRDDLGNEELLVPIAPGVYEGVELQGVAGRTYTLSVEIGAEEFVASSTLPAKVPLLGVRFEPSAFPGTEGEYVVVPLYQDPEERGNQYRFVQFLDQIRDPSYLVNNDNIGNGAINEIPIRSMDFPVTSGSELTLEMRCIDRATYLYFFSLSQQVAAGPGGGTTPSNPPNNFNSAKVLGYFSAHTVEKITARVP